MNKDQLRSARKEMALEIIKQSQLSVEGIDLHYYGGFVIGCLVNVGDDDLELYCSLGLYAELGELDQVLCKSLRPGYDVEKTINNFWSELSDVVYWVTAIKMLQFELPDLEVYPWLEILTPELTQQVARINFNKLNDRKDSTGSFTK